MKNRWWAAMLIVTMLGAGSPAFTQDSVSPKLLPPAAALRTQIATRDLAFPAGDEPSKPAPPPRRHWSKTGKILTIVGAGLIGAGTVAIVHGQNTQVACSGNTCVDVAWRDTGIAWAAGGAALMIVGATRHTTD